MAQQTALEWFFENIDNEILKSEYYYMYQRAKQMEKEQIMKAYKDYHDLGHIYGLETEQYYNKTYGTEGR